MFLKCYGWQNLDVQYHRNGVDIYFQLFIHKAHIVLICDHELWLMEDFQGHNRLYTSNVNLGCDDFQGHDHVM